MSLTATPVPETVGAFDQPPVMASSPAHPAGGALTPVGAPSATTDHSRHNQTAAPQARPDGEATMVDEGRVAPDMAPPSPAGSTPPSSPSAVGGGEEPLVPVTAPPGSEANPAPAAAASHQAPATPADRHGGGHAAARSGVGGAPSLSQAGRDAAATIAAVGGPAMEAVAAQARKPPPGISLRRSKAELQAVLEAEPYPGPFPSHRPAWEVPYQSGLGDGERPPGAPARVRIADLYPGKYEELVRTHPHTHTRAGAAARTDPPPPRLARPVSGATVDPRSRTARPPDQALARCGQAGQDALL